MAASFEDISNWFDRGLERGAEFMMVVTDTYDYTDSPVYVSEANFAEKIKEYKWSRTNSSRVQEVYNLSMDKAPQMAANRAQNYPKSYDPMKVG